MKYYATKISDKGNLAVDDTILVKGVQTAAGSRILEGFKPLFSAEAVTRLEEKGLELGSKTEIIESTYPKGYIVEQQYPENYTLKIGASVNVKINKFMYEILYTKNKKSDSYTMADTEKQIFFLLFDFFSRNANAVAHSTT